MARVCELTGTRTQSGNNVSHSQRKTKRKFYPNLHKVTLKSDALGLDFAFRITKKALKTLELQGGLDNFLKLAKPEQLSKSATKVRKKIKDLLKVSS